MEAPLTPSACSPNPNVLLGSVRRLISSTPLFSLEILKKSERDKGEADERGKFLAT